MPNHIYYDQQDWNSRACLSHQIVINIYISVLTQRDVEIVSRITNDNEFRDFARDLEGTPHTNLHQWVGGAMRDRWAPDGKPLSEYFLAWVY